ncbi:MAG: hypothetical protein HY248_05570, partial [Fimbriimonas ginsengisoli]|nr:hypothetical protein [Fimbriimonas ginsengisoli]
MINPLPGIVFAVLAGLGWLLFGGTIAQSGGVLYAGWLLASGLAASSLRLAAQWEKALVFRLGRFRSTRGPGIFTVMPLLDSVRLVDTRILTLAIPMQQAI